MLVGRTQSIEVLNGTTRLTFSQVRGKSSCLFLNWDIFFFLPLNSNLNIGSSCILSLLIFGLELHHQLSWAFSLPMAELDPYQPLLSCKPIPEDKSNTHTHTQRHPIGSISLKNSKAHTFTSAFISVT